MRHKQKLFSSYLLFGAFSLLLLTQDSYSYCTSFGISDETQKRKSLSRTNILRISPSLPPFEDFEQWACFLSNQSQVNIFKGECNSSMVTIWFVLLPQPAIKTTCLVNVNSPRMLFPVHPQSGSIQYAVWSVCLYDKVEADMKFRHVANWTQVCPSITHAPFCSSFTWGGGSQISGVSSEHLKNIQHGREES